MISMNCSHDKVLIPFKSGGGGHAVEEFENYLLNDSKRIIEEHNREIQQQNIYDNDNILGPENLDSTGLAVWQWLNDNPGWWDI